MTWSRSGLNRRPPACHAGALPTELRPHEVELSRAQCRTASESISPPPVATWLRRVPRRSLSLGVMPTKFWATSPPLKIRTVGNALDVPRHGNLPVVIDVHLADLGPAGILLGKRIDRGRERLAGLAPLGPEIHQYRNVRVQDIGLESIVGEGQYVVGCHGQVSRS